MLTPSERDITAVVLCGGLGTRLREVLPNKPKVLAEINGVPFIYYLLRKIEKTGCRNVILCTGHLAEQVESLLGYEYGELTIVYSKETSPMGTGGALLNAEQYITTNYVLVMNGDSFVECDFRDYYYWHIQVGAKLSMIVKKTSDTSRYGSLSLSAERQITKFQEKVCNYKREGKFINVGVYLMDHRILQKIPKKLPVSLEKEVFPKLLSDGVFGYRIDGRFIDIGTPQSLAEAQEYFR
ncbi:uncharacterized protein METZ01_LOCUS151781 [marine metagenome]|uniref:Nucleotidyl transferase domain-containing protein n=1 Tax=marine metagenome TaxID=408172 RepID=A0A382AD54_9ZZZZ